MTASRLSKLRRIGTPDRLADGLRVFLALLGVMLYGYLSGRPQQMIALLLGVIAAAVAETDDNWRQRLAALTGTLLCFAIAAFAVELLFPHPGLFGAALALGSALLVMLGVASRRYATITNATLLLAVYMVGIVQHPASAPASPWHEPLLLIIGAAWYGVLAALWSTLIVQQPVRLSLARLYQSLDAYLQIKASLFQPVHDLPVTAIRAELAQANRRVVDALNDCRTSLIDRLERRQRHVGLQRALRLYLAAQDIHERASSSHYPYAQLAETFFHSDVLFRGQRLILALAASCAARAKAARRGAAYREPSQTARAHSDLLGSIAYLRRHSDTLPGPLMQALERLADNMGHLRQRIQRAGADYSADRTLQNPAPKSLRESWQRIRIQLTPTSMQFRHALRLGLAMLVGDIVMRLVYAREGYWILLTIMLVCQPSFGATRTRLLQRVSGTLAGLLAGWALLKLIPDPRLQLALTVLAGVVFFVARYRQYLIATAAVTVLVLLAFNQIGSGFDLIMPRLIDTLLGSAIAVAATFLVLPDWRQRELRQLFADALAADARYLEQIATQYASGKHDDLDYRIARRDAHNADAQLSGHLGSVLNDPAGQRTDTESVLRLLTSSQELIGHLSTLGAHRQRLPHTPDTAQQLDQARHLAARLRTIATQLGAGHVAPPPGDTADAVASDAARAAPVDGAHAGLELVATQLSLLRTQLTTLTELAAAMNDADD